MKYLLDTNVLSDLRRRQAAVVRWTMGQPDDDFAISAVSLMELERGVLLVERRDPRQGRALRRWLDEQVVPEFSGRTIAVDADVAVRAASLHVPNPMPTEDAYIGATALVHDLELVTRNTEDFAIAGLRVVDPWRS